MPLYEYHCEECGRDLERLVSFKDRDTIYCPNCGTKPDRRLSTFSWKWDNPFTRDGEGFTSRDVPLGELKEMSQETRER